MQKMKRIEKWDCLHTNCNENKKNTNIINMTSSIPTTTTPVILPNWTKWPQAIINNNNSSSILTSNTNRIGGNRRTSKTNDKSRNQHSRTRTTVQTMSTMRRHHGLLTMAILIISIDNFTAAAQAKADVMYASTTPFKRNDHAKDETETTTETRTTMTTTTMPNTTTTTTTTADWLQNGTSSHGDSRRPARPGSGSDSIFMQFAKRFSTGNELWDGIIRDCYRRPTFSCFQKNVYVYLNEALDANDVNVTQRLKFFKNQIDYEESNNGGPTEAAAAAMYEETEKGGGSSGAAEGGEADEHLLNNEIPHEGRGAAAAATAAETPIEEVTNALYGKSMKFAMTHDIELKLPEMMFDGATFRISPRSIEGNGIIAKLEMIPKQEVEARLAGKIIMKKIQKFLKSKILLSFLALVLIIKIIKVKLFWLLPIVIGVGAAKKLLLKFLLFLFPALSHLFKLCSYYQTTYHSTKYHHHHHLINHQHTVLPAWHNAEHNPGPELIYTHPPKGHPSAYLHGAPIHETYGPPHSHEHFDQGWENSGPGLGSEYISDVHRVAQIDENSNHFKPHTNDANEIHSWGLGSTQPTLSQQQQQQKLQQQLQQQKQRLPATQQQRPPPLQKYPQQQQQQQQQQQPHQYQKPHATSHSFNPFLNPDKQSIFGTNLKMPSSAPGPVYTPSRNSVNGNHGHGQQPPPPPPPQQQSPSTAQIAAQYDPTRGNPQQQQQQLSPELSAQLKEAIRIQAEQRIVAQQQKILDHQPFVQDGQPIMPKNYDPFYSPMLLKIDKIVEQLGVTDDLCKERLVCSMYKDPTRYSPHSNFVSAELSRDTSELQPVTNTNQAVMRFYRLIQAARDGQDHKDCLRLYPQCNINTE